MNTRYMERIRHKIKEYTICIRSSLLNEEILIL